MPICKECKKDVAVLATGCCPSGMVQFDMCEDCFARIWDEIYNDEETDEEDLL